MAAAESSLPGWRETLVAAAGFLALSVLCCQPAALALDHLPFDQGDGIGSWFPHMLRVFRPPAADVAGSFDPTVFTGLPEGVQTFPAVQFYEDRAPLEVTQNPEMVAPKEENRR